MGHGCQFKKYSHDPVKQIGSIVWKEFEGQDDACGAEAHFKVKVQGKPEHRFIWFCAKHYDFWVKFCHGNPDPDATLEGTSGKTTHWCLG